MNSLAHLPHTSSGTFELPHLKSAQTPLIPIAAVHDALGNAIRHDTLARLQAGSLNVNQLTQHHPISRPAISKLLKILRDANLVTAYPNGTRNEYVADQTGFAEARAWLDSYQRHDRAVRSPLSTARRQTYMRPHV